MSKYKVGSNQFQVKLKIDETGLPTKSKLNIILKVIYFAVLLIAVYDLTVFLSPTQSEASENVNQGVSQKAIDPAKSMGAEATIATPPATLKPATREEKLKVFLESKNSPLTTYADYIVKVSDEYDLSWTLIVSIAGKESSFGRHIKPNSFNAWGVMQWDEKGKRSIRSFTSWKEGILFEAKLLSNSYRANMNKAIQEKYCPSFECSDTWVTHVTGFQKEINN